MVNQMMKKFCSIAVIGILSPFALADVMRVHEELTVDGVLDEAVWARASWESDFRRTKDRAQTKGPMKKTAFAILADERTVYVGVRCQDPNVAALKQQPVDDIWVTEDVEIFLSPTGNPFDYYHFAYGPKADHSVADFRSEGGNIRPDPYAPVWRRATAWTDDGWTAEFAIPLSAFYMTPNSEWRTTWLVNVGRTLFGPADVLTWAPLESGFHESKRFLPMKGFPMRRAEDDVSAYGIVAEMRGLAADGSLEGDLRMEVRAGKAGEYRVAVSSGGETTHRLRAGKNKLSVPCHYGENGRFPTHITVTEVATGMRFERDYPVLVDFKPVRVKLTRPQYRSNFYPGQDASVVEGRLETADGRPAELTLAGPGFPERKATVASGSGFTFDTKGFRDGDAWLSVKVGDSVERVRIRRLPPTGHQMVWIENGHLVANGRPTFRRNMYAQGFMGGKAFDERYAAEKDSFRMTDHLNGGPSIEMNRLIRGIERHEGLHDGKPSEALMKKLEETMLAMEDKEFCSWYISDEPECRGVSPIYLRHIYERAKELDPYHPVFMASRGGKTYIDCADWFETHPYLNPSVNEDGTRRYGRHPREIGSFIEAFGGDERPDKCIGFLPTCFTYEFSNPSGDYPTFEEYEWHTWAAIIRGAMTLYPYAYHDLGDRPSIYNGTRYMFESVAALENLVLGKRTTLFRNDDGEAALFEADGEKLIVAVNYSDRALPVAFPDVEGEFREFRGSRTFAGGKDGVGPVTLPPRGTLVAATRPNDADLEARAATLKRVTDEERARCGRDSQLVNRWRELEVESNMTPNWNGGHYKLFDGMTEMIARASEWKTNSYVTVSFPQFVPAFAKVRLYGYGIGSLTVEIRKGGVWQKLEPKSVKTEKWMRELDFGRTFTTVKMRLTFPRPEMPKQRIEIYEIELPRAGCGDGSATAAKRTAEPQDEGVVWRLDGSNCQESEKWSSDKWIGTNRVRANASGGLTVVTNASHVVRLVPDAKWIVVDFSAFRKRTESAYTQWAMWLDGAFFARTVSHPMAGLYTFEFTPPEKQVSRTLEFRCPNLDVDIAGISLVRSPANYVRTRGDPDRKAISPGGTLSVAVKLAEPCEELSVELLQSTSQWGFKPFLVNGNNALELKPVGGDGCHWAVKLPVTSCSRAGANEVFVRASTLGGGLKRPIYGQFKVPFDNRSQQ